MLSFLPAPFSRAKTLTQAWVFKTYKCVSKCIWKCQNAHTFIWSLVKCTLIRHIRRNINIDIHSWHCLQRSEDLLLHWGPALSRNPSLKVITAPPTNIDYNNLKLSYNNDSPYEDIAPISTRSNGWDALKIFSVTMSFENWEFAGT